MITPVQIAPVPGIPDIRPGDDLARILGDALESSGLGLQPTDILCIAHKVFSKSEGCVIDPADITPSPEAEKLGQELNKDPRKVEVVLRQSTRVIRAFKRPEQNQGTMICEHRLGFISANSGVDESNAEAEGSLITLPDDPDASARALAADLKARFGIRPGVVMSDTFGRPWRLGQVNVAIGLSDVPATLPELGKTDAWGRALTVTEPAFADEIAAASGLVMGKAAKTPMILFRGLDWVADANASAQDILRAKQEDMFR